MIDVPVRSMREGRLDEKNEQTVALGQTRGIGGQAAAHSAASGAAGLKICCGTMLLSGSVAAASAHSVRPAAARQPVIRISRAGGSDRCA